MFLCDAVIHALCISLDMNHIQRTAPKFNYNTCYNTKHFAKLWTSVTPKRWTYDICWYPWLGSHTGKSLRESHYVAHTWCQKIRVSRENSETWKSSKMDKSKKARRNSLEWRAADLIQFFSESNEQHSVNYELLKFRNIHTYIHTYTHDTHSGHHPSPAGRSHNRFCQGVDVRCCIAAPTMSGPQLTNVFCSLRVILM